MARRQPRVGREAFRRHLLQLRLTLSVVIHMKIHRAWLYLFSVLLACALRIMPAAAQPGEGWEPTRCPQFWRPGPYRGVLLIGSLTEFRGYYFNVRWERSSEARVGLGFYRPAGGIVPVEAFLHRVEWRSAGVLVECWKKVIQRSNGPSSDILSERIYDKAGRIVERSKDEPGEEGCGELDSAPYDPYSPTDDPGCGDPGDTGDGTGGGEGSGDDKTGCHSEYVMIEISYDDGATWEVYWEGFATVCD